MKINVLLASLTWFSGTCKALVIKHSKIVKREGATASGYSERSRVS